MVETWLISRGTLAGEARELRARGHDAVELLWSSVPFPASPAPDIVRWMMVPEHSVFQLGYIEELERDGARVINRASAVTNCDKLSILALHHRHLSGVIDAPASHLAVSVDDALAFISEQGRAIVKPLAGQAGSGIEIIDSAMPGLEAYLANHIDREGVVFLQQVIDNVRAEIRTIIAGDEVIAQYDRGARGQPCRPVRETDSNLLPGLAEAAGRARNITGLDTLALDAIVDGGGKPWLIEWNPFFGYGHISAAWLDIAGHMAEFIIHFALG
jgi:glutathione synthase/RimK-type ligase-like ATP-grasp enzyme